MQDLAMVFAVRALWEHKVWMTEPNASLAPRVTNVITRVWVSSSALLGTTPWKGTTLPVLLALQAPTAPLFLTPHSPVPRGPILAIEPPTAPHARQGSSVWIHLRVPLLVPQGAIVSEGPLAAPPAQVEAIVLKRIQLLSLAPQDTTQLMAPPPALNAKLGIIVLTKDRQQNALSELIHFHDLKLAKFVPKDISALARLF
jgi:hypothetical protein